MNKPFEWDTQFNNEIQLALDARASGNEGKARVCARRAASIVAGRYLSLQGIQTLGMSSYEILKLLNSLPDTSDSIRKTTGHLILRVDKDFNLPTEVDLISDAKNLVVELFGGDLEFK